MYLRLLFWAQATSAGISFTNIKSNRPEYVVSRTLGPPLSVCLDIILFENINQTNSAV